VIADGSRAVAVAGVMGGEESEITADTTSLILESANFNAPSVRRTAQAMGMRTDASSRFEKGLPAEATVSAIERFVHLLAEITEDPVTVYGVSDSWPSKAEPRTVAMPMRDLRRLLGIDVPPETASEILGRLGFDIGWEGDTLLAVVPSWRRVDIQSSADLVEEVGRIVGFDAIPSTLPFRTLEPPVPSPGWAWEQRVRERLRALGVNETVTHSITSPALMARATLTGEPPAHEDWSRVVAASNAVVEQGATVQPVRLINPATVDRQVMRLTLVPSLLDVAAHNIKHTDEHLAFFEVARTYFPLEKSPLAYEPRSLGIVLTGRRTPRSWQNASPAGYSFFDLKGMIECVLDDMHIREWSALSADHPMLHPGRAAALMVGGQRAGYFGELHPLVAERFDLAAWPVQVAELNLDVLVDLARDAPIFEPLPRYPAAFRDIAVLLDSEVAADRVLALVQEGGASLLAGARVFDVYRGANIPEGKQSMAIEMSFQSPERTLTQAEVDDVMALIVATLHTEVGATLRD
jgi:phenylalanyl-tRNA synthetase beta chain